MNFDHNSWLDTLPLVFGMVVHTMKKDLPIWITVIISIVTLTAGVIIGIGAFYISTHDTARDTIQNSQTINTLMVEMADLQKFKTKQEESCSTIKAQIIDLESARDKLLSLETKLNEHIAYDTIIEQQRLHSKGH